MATELPVERARKYLVQGDGWRGDVVQQTHLRHGFLAEQDQIEVRVRIRDDKVASLTLKISTCDLKRAEFAFDTGLGEADALLEHCKGAVLEKMLYTVLTDHKGQS